MSLTSVNQYLVTLIIFQIIGITIMNIKIMEEGVVVITTYQITLIFRKLPRNFLKSYKIILKMPIKLSIMIIPPSKGSKKIFNPMI